MSSSAERTPVRTVLRSPEELSDAVPFRPGTVRGAETAEPGSSARAEGYATGWAQGIREARAATDAARAQAKGDLDRMLAERDERARLALRAVRAAADQVQATAVQRAEEILDAVVVAAVELAETLAGAALAADLVEAARSNIRRALTELPAETPVVVRVNPADHAELGPITELAPGMTVTLVPDPAVERGGAVAETKVTTVDATLSAAVRRVRAELAA